jgi:hypothetical protein
VCVCVCSRARTRHVFFVLDQPAVSRGAHAHNTHMSHTYTQIHTCAYAHMIYTYAHTHTIFLLLITYNADNADTQFCLPLLCAAFAYPKLKPVFIRQYKLPSRFIWYDCNGLSIWINGRVRFRPSILRKSERALVLCLLRRSTWRKHSTFVLLHVRSRVPINSTSPLLSALGERLRALQPLEGFKKQHQIQKYVGDKNGFLWIVTQKKNQVLRRTPRR